MRKVKKSVALEIEVEMSDEFTDCTGSFAAEASILNTIAAIKDTYHGPCKFISVSVPTFGDF